MSELDELRKKIRDFDNEIIKLMSQRMATAQRIGEIKSQKNLPIKNYDVEKSLIEKNQSIAIKMGLDPDLAKEITKTLISYSVRIQDEFQSEKARQNFATEENVVIAGGLGQMGQWLAEFFESFGYGVKIFDPGVGDQKLRYGVVDHLTEACEQSQIIVSAAPISTTANIIKDIADIGTKALVFDICSLKSPVTSSIHYALDKGVAISSAHPMFGPNTSILAGRNIVICETGHKDADQKTSEIFGATTARIIKVGLNRHDELMSYVLGLSHLTNLIFADVLTESSITYEDMQSVASTTFNAMLDVAGPVVRENESLYFEIQAENAYSKKLLDELHRSVAKYRSFIESADAASFKTAMKQSRRFFDDEISSS